MLSQIAQNLLASKRQAQAMVLQAEEDAYLRALNEAAAQRYWDAIAAGAAGTGSSSGGGGGGGGGDGGGGGGGTAPAPSVAAQIAAGVPWQVAAPLSTLNPNDIRVRRLQ